VRLSLQAISEVLMARNTSLANLTFVFLAHVNCAVMLQNIYYLLEHRRPRWKST